MTSPTITNHKMTMTGWLVAIFYTDRLYCPIWPKQEKMKASTADMICDHSSSCVSGIDSELGLTTVRSRLQSAPELPAHPPALLNEATVALTKKLEPSQARKLQMSQQLTVWSKFMTTKQQRRLLTYSRAPTCPRVVGFFYTSRKQLQI